MNKKCDMTAAYIAEDRMSEKQCLVFNKILDSLGIGKDTEHPASIESALIAAREEREAFERGLSLGQIYADVLETLYVSSAADFRNFGAESEEGKDLAILVMSYVLNVPKEQIEENINGLKSC